MARFYVYAHAAQPPNKNNKRKGQVNKGSPSKKNNSGHFQYAWLNTQMKFSSSVINYYNMNNKGAGSVIQGASSFSERLDSKNNPFLGIIIIIIIMNT